MVDPARQAARQLLDESLTMLLPSRRRRSELLDASGTLKQRGEPGSEAGWLRVPLARLEALAAVGMVSREEASQWRVRFQRALELCDRPRPHPPTGLQDRARRYLEDREREVQAARELASLEDLDSDSQSTVRGAEIRIAQARYCFAELGLLADREAYVQPPPPPGPRRTELQTVAAAPGEQPEQSDRSGADVPLAPQRTELRAVALVQDRRSRAVRLTSAELYADAIVLRWNFLLPREPDHGERQINNQDLGWLLDQGKRHAPDLQLTDDNETPYQANPRPRIGGPHGPTPTPTPLVIWGATTFTPAAPTTAHRLQATLDGRQIQIDLANS